MKEQKEVNKKYRLAFVIPRYNCGLSGGVERYCQDLAENAQAKGHEVTVLTTKARDHYSWRNEIRTKKEVINGVTVLRFSTNERNTDIFLKMQDLIDSYIKLSDVEETVWIQNSVNSEELEAHIRKYKEQYDCFIFMPYLFGITYHGALIHPEKSLLIPCLHHESYAYLTIFKQMFNKVRGIIFNAHAEMHLAEQLYTIPREKEAWVGVGVEENKTYPVNPIAFKEKHKISFPYILFIGRKEEGKNLPLLLRYFSRYKQQNHNDLKLLLLGSGSLKIPEIDTENIVDLGFVPEEDKAHYIASALALCHPSLYESFSIVMMEAWLHEIPALVHGNCAVTKDHVLKGQGGLYFTTYQEFSECLNYFIENQNKARAMGQNGKRYVQKNFNWDAVLTRFERALLYFFG